MSDPFEFINSINDHNYVADDNDLKDYNPFLTMINFSFFPDTILIANQLNMYGRVTKKQHYDYLFFSVSRKKRYSKWFKKENDEDISFLQEVFKCSYVKAKEYSNLLTELQKKELRKKWEKGGVNK